MAWYPEPSNTTVGLHGIINTTNYELDAMIGGLGGNMLGISILIPLWVVIFIPLGRISPLAAFTLASFVCWLVSAYLMTLNMISSWAFLLLSAMWVVGAIVFYLHTRS